MSVGDKPNTLRAQMKHHEPIICFTVKTKQIDMRAEEGKAHPLDSNDDKEPQTVCFAWANSGDAGLSAAESAPTVKSSRNGSPAVCYALEGNTVDRASRKNGRGWCENVSPTLNTQDRHAIAFQLCGDRTNPSVSSSEKAYCLPANPMSDRGQAVVFRKVCNPPVRTPNVVCIEGNGSRQSHQGPGFQESDQMYTLNTIERHAVCYIVDAQSSNSFKSNNPHSVFHETEVSK